MSFQPRALPLLGALVLLAACGGGQGADGGAAAADARPGGDAAINGALNESLATDTELAALSDADAVRPVSGVAAGAVPRPVPGSPAAAQEARAAQAEALKALGGKLDRAPRPSDTGRAPERAVTLAAMAREPAVSRGAAQRTETDGCSRSITYGPQWAERLPAPFVIYPRANLVEAAGVSNGRCDIVIASFTTPVAVDEVVDYYYTLARRGAYDAEHLLGGGEHRLGGMRGKDGPAYLIFARTGEGGLTEVDILANIS